MARFKNNLRHVRIAAPCKADWDQMLGSDQIRFCGQCSLNVYNLSGMTRADAESLIAANEGRLCIRFYRRADGSIITRECPVGLRAIRRRVSYLVKATTAALLAFLGSAGVHALAPLASNAVPERTMGVMAVHHELESGYSVPNVFPQAVAGKFGRIDPHNRRHR